MKNAAVLFVTFLFATLTSCGDSYNARLFQGSVAKSSSNLSACKAGCFGIPQNWYDKGLIVKPDGSAISKPDASVKLQGACYFKVCVSDVNSPYTKGAQEWVERFGGGLINETDPVKCANLAGFSTLSSGDDEIDFNQEVSADCR